MANWYINPGLGSGTNAGTSWANAFNSTTTAWTDAITASSAGDDFYVNAASTVSNSTAQTLTFKGTSASPNRVFSCSTITNNPPVTADLGVGAAHTTTGAVTTAIRGFVYIYGCTFTAGSGANNATLSFGTAGSSDITLDTCKCILAGTTGASVITVGVATANLSQRTTFINTTVKFASTGSGFNLTAGTFRWIGKTSAIDATGTLPTAIFPPGSAAVAFNALCDGVDLSAATNKALTGATFAAGAFQFVNCKLPTGYTVGVPTASSTSATDLIISDSGNTNYKVERYAYQGTLTTSTTVHNNATDGTTGVGWSVATTANATASFPFECPQIVQWVAAGTYVNSKIFMTSATASLKTNDAWVEVEYLGNGSFPLASQATTLGAGSGTALLPQIPAGTTPGSIAAASPAWVTGGLGNDYQIAIPSFTTAQAGYVRFTVKIAKPSVTIVVDPAATIAA